MYTKDNIIGLEVSMENKEAQIVKVFNDRVLLMAGDGTNIFHLDNVILWLNSGVWLVRVNVERIKDEALLKEYTQFIKDKIHFIMPDHVLPEFIKQKYQPNHPPIKWDK